MRLPGSALDHTTKPSLLLLPKPEFQYQAHMLTAGACLGLGSMRMWLLSVSAPLSAGGQSPGPCSLPSVLAQEVPQVRKPVLCRSSLPWGTGPTWILPAPFFSSSLSRLRGGLSFSAGYLRYPAALGWCSVKIVPVLSVVLMYLWVEWTLRSSTSPLQSPPSKRYK